MRRLNNPLSKQLLSIAVISVIIIIISLGLLLPNILLPVYERNIYQQLKLPLELLGEGFNKFEFDEVAYIYITDNQEILISDNLEKLIPIKTEIILKETNKDHGKFLYKGKTYYYSKNQNQFVTKISITNDNLITKIKSDLLKIILPVLSITLVLISTLLLLWSHRVIKKIEKLRNMVDNLNNEKYKHQYNYEADDELKILSEAIDNMKINLIKQEEYKNQMYQNISHDFKTPLAVINSYIEAVEDGIENKENALKIIKDQVKKIDIKVRSLLYLNKLTYISNLENYKNEKIDIKNILNESLKKFKLIRKDIEWQINYQDKKTIFNGTQDMWEAIIDNLLHNFIRYADKTIKITLKNNKIIFYNDGPSIDLNILNNIFTPYKKGINGEFGLGLSIVKKSVELIGYDIIVTNEKKGVSFIIK